MIKRILLDLDDVCNQMTMWSLRWIGCDVDPMSNSQFPVECGYDIVAAANKLHPDRDDWTVPEFWDAIVREAWATVPESPEFRFILDFCERLVGRENVFIATSPTKDPDCLAGKLEWIHDHFPEWMWRQYAITPRKYIAANRETLLIDDSYANYKSFTKHGGHCLLVPKPWNPYHGIDTRKYLEEAFAIIRGEL